MPYIPQEQRNKYQDLINDIIALQPNIGEINFIFTSILKGMKANSYLEHCLMMGTLSCVAEEYYRKIVVPYEEKKIIENGEL